MTEVKPDPENRRARHWKRLAAAVIVLAAVHIRQERGRTVTISLQAVVAVLVIAAAVATLVQTYRVGDSGARAAWGNVTSSAP